MIHLINKLIEHLFSHVEHLKKEILRDIETADPVTLDSIYRLLNRRPITSRIKKSLNSTLSNFNGVARNDIIDDVTDVIFGLNTPTSELNRFIDAVESDNVIDIRELTRPRNTFSSIFINQSAVECFDRLRMYGNGKKQKGPGEYALTILSDKIQFAEHGDLFIDGVGQTELKVQIGASGGRLGHHGFEIGKTISALKGIRGIPSLTDMLNTGKTVSLKTFISLVNNDRPAPAVRKKIAETIYPPIFRNHADDFCDAFSRSTDEKRIIGAFIKMNWRWYKYHYPFDVMLALAFNSQKSMTIRDENDVMRFIESGDLGSVNPSVIPSRSGGAREIYMQLKINKNRNKNEQS